MEITWTDQRPQKDGIYWYRGGEGERYGILTGFCEVVKYAAATDSVQVFGLPGRLEAGDMRGSWSAQPLEAN